MGDDAKLIMAGIFAMVVIVVSGVVAIYATQSACYEAAKVNHELRCDK